MHPRSARVLPAATAGDRAHREKAEDGRRETGDGRREKAEDGRRTTDEGRRTTDPPNKVAQV
eukprot:3521522-Prymnesium_polylepis.1